MPSDTDTSNQNDRYEEFLRLLARHESRLFAYILTLLPHWADAEEVFQEMSIVLWRSFDRFELGTDFRAWARRTALHQVIAFRRRQKRDRIQLAQVFVETVAAEYEEQADSLDARLRALAQCIEKLKPRDHELLSQYYRSGGTKKAAAEQLGRPADTVYKALKRVRRSLFDCINRTMLAESS